MTLSSCRVALRDVVSAAAGTVADGQSSKVVLWGLVGQPPPHTHIRGRSLSGQLKNQLRSLAVVQQPGERLSWATVLFQGLEESWFVSAPAETGGLSNTPEADFTARPRPAGD